MATLERLGYLVESSVAPLFYETHKGGPEFVEAPLKPYFLAYDSATDRAPAISSMVPVSAALNRALPKTLQYAYARAPKPYTTKRVLRALRLLRMRWLRPSWSSVEDMIGLARDLARWDEPVLNLLFHSSEAISAAVRTTRRKANSTHSAIDWIGSWHTLSATFAPCRRPSLNSVPRTRTLMRILQ